VGDAIGQMLPSAVGVAVSPLPIVAVVLMLVTPRGRVNGPAFVAGWCLGLAILGAIVLSVAGGADSTSSSGPATWVSVVLLIVGLLLLALAVRQWRTRPAAGEDPPPPKWMGAIDTFTPVKSLGAGALFSSLNPKNLLLAVAGAAEIADTGISAGSEAVAWAIFVVIASLGVAAPVVLYFALGTRSQEILENLKTWLAHNNATIMSVLFLIIGFKVVGEAISGFST
jgi:threonine/homoserine/homoserine lactone efflux protein